MANKVIVQAPIYEQNKRALNEDVIITAITGSTSSVTLNENVLSFILKL